MRRILAVVILLLMMAPGCNKDKQPLIPYAYVNIRIYPNSAIDYIPIGGYRYLAEGYRGIIVYQLLPGEFAVYERCCPYDPEKTGARVTVDATNSICTDSVCGSQFLLYDGTPLKGPSPYSLMQYRWNYNSETDELLIYN